MRLLSQETNKMKIFFVNVLLISIVIACICYVESGIAGIIPTLNSPAKDILTRVINNTTTPEILWFYDDDGNLVKPTLDLLSLAEIEVTTVDDKVIFTLYTNEKPEGEPLTLNNPEKLKATKFDPAKETVFITHGWVNSQKSQACTLIRDAYLKKGGYNIIVVDWSKISLRPYGWAASHVKKVGQHVANMIDFLETQGMDLNKLKLIGHSLGAQVMGSAGFHAKNKVNYIVGLDPALPLFYNSRIGSRISTHDAKNVEIIHTNAGLLGILVPLGHVDFYPNGGYRQIGCLADPGGACSHARSYELFAESITSEKGFYGKPCNDFLKTSIGECSGEPYLMGGLKNRIEKKGVYFVNTKETAPFAVGIN